MHKTWYRQLLIFHRSSQFSGFAVLDFRFALKGCAKSGLTFQSVWTFDLIYVHDKTSIYTLNEADWIDYWSLEDFLKFKKIKD